MAFNGKIKIIIAGVALLLLVAAAGVLLYIRGNKADAGETEPLESIPSGAAVLTPLETGTSDVTEQSGQEIPSGEDYSSYPLSTPSDCQAVIDQYAADHGIDPFSYPVEIVNLLMSNHETLDFVLHYPESIGTQDSPDYPGTVDVSSDYSSLRMPEYYQYDIRWGYKSYGGNVLGITGGGPTALSMAASYLLNNSDLNPAWMAAYAENNGFMIDGGTDWMLMTEGAIGLGIDVTPITADQDRIDRNLDVGNIVMCLMGPGDFTNTVQFVIIVGKTDSGYEIRDPGSPARTAATWTFDTLAPQMNGCWIMRIL
ncbi:MAG: hypothetical protein J6127_07235 [Clostridiales bacterium]|nr:hypothetical protein [Clostridiales bacterium]